MTSKTRKTNRPATTLANHKIAVGALVTIETCFRGQQLARIENRLPSVAGEAWYCVRFLDNGVGDRYEAAEMVVV